MADLARYARQVILPEVGVAGQQVLLDSSALIVGCGGLGSPAALYLAAAGVGRLILADRDRVERSNLQRQLLFAEADVGRAKTAAAQDRLRAHNAALRVELLPDGTASVDFQAALASADVVLDCTDNFPTRFAINAACAAARKPLVSGAAIRWEGQVCAFDLRTQGPCYACLYPDAGDAAEACEQAGIVGPVVGVIGALQGLMALQMLLGHRDVSGVLHHWNARAGDWRKLRVTRDPECPVCHRAHAEPHRS